MYSYVGLFLFCLSNRSLLDVHCRPLNSISSHLSCLRFYSPAIADFHSCLFRFSESDTQSLHWGKPMSKYVRSKNSYTCLFLFVLIFFLSLRNFKEVIFSMTDAHATISYADFVSDRPRMIFWHLYLVHRLC